MASAVAISWQGSAGLGWAWTGMEWRGEAGSGAARQHAGPCAVGQIISRRVLSMRGEAGRGLVRRGLARQHRGHCGSVSPIFHGPHGRGVAGQVWNWHRKRQGRDWNTRTIFAAWRG